MYDLKRGLINLSPIKYPSPQGDFVLQLELTQPYP